MNNKTEIGEIIGFNRSAVSKILKTFEQREYIEHQPIQVDPDQRANKESVH